MRMWGVVLLRADRFLGQTIVQPVVVFLRVVGVAVGSDSGCGAGAGDDDHGYLCHMTVSLNSYSPSPLCFPKV